MSELPVDPNQAMATQSVQALMIAHNLGLLSYRKRYDTRDEAQVGALRELFGADVVLPDEPGVYYLAYVVTDDEEPLAVLIPEGEARSMAFILAVKAGHGPELLYRRGMLPG